MSGVETEWSGKVRGMGKVTGMDDVRSREAEKVGQHFSSMSAKHALYNVLITL